MICQQFFSSRAGIAEIKEHLGYKNNNILGNNSGNSRNGYGKKALKTPLGETETQVSASFSAGKSTIYVGGALTAPP